MLSLSYDLPVSVMLHSLQFTDHLPWPHGMVNSQLNVRFRIFLELVGHPSIFAYYFVNTVNSDLLLVAYNCVYSRELCYFRWSHWSLYEWVIESFTQSFIQKRRLIFVFILQSDKDVVLLLLKYSLQYYCGCYISHNSCSQAHFDILKRWFRCLDHRGESVLYNFSKDYSNLPHPPHHSAQNLYTKLHLLFLRHICAVLHNYVWFS